MLLRPSEKKRLQKLAREAKVSSSEIIRRSIHAYESSAMQKEQEEMQSVVAEMNRALDAALKSVRSARTEVAENIAKMRKLREKRA